MGETMNRGELASLCGVTPATVDGWIEQGIPCQWAVARSGRGRGKRQQPLFDADQVFVWWQQPQVARLKSESS